MWIAWRNLGFGMAPRMKYLALADELSVSGLARLADDGAAERLERRGLVTMERRQRRRVCPLAHPLYGDAITSELSASARVT